MFARVLQGFAQVLRALGQYPGLRLPVCALGLRGGCLGVDLALPTRHQLQRGFLRSFINMVVNTQLHIIRGPAEVVVVTHNALRVDNHAGGK